MIRDPKDLKRYEPSERANHWAVGISFILLALSGLALFHPAFFPLTQLFGGPVWNRILHPYVGVFMALAFLVMVLRFWRLNVITKADKAWLSKLKPGDKILFAAEMKGGNAIISRYEMAK